MQRSHFANEAEKNSASLSSQDVMAMFRALSEGVPAILRSKVGAVATAHGQQLSDVFYETLLGHEQARTYLTTELVSDRLKASMQKWITSLFEPLDEATMPAFVARNIAVGEVHARIKLPAPLMQVGIRILIQELRRHLANSDIAVEELGMAQLYATDLLYLADGLMMSAYVRSTQQHVRADETYRHAIMRQNTSLERERQRAFLSEWVNDLLFSNRFNGAPNKVPRLGESDFGHWLKHKGKILFETVPDVQLLHDAIANIDETVLPNLLASVSDPLASQRHYEELKRQIDFIRYLLGDLFDRLSSIDEGRDTVTGLSSRRHLAAVLARETEEHARSGSGFGLLLMRIDNLDHTVGMDESQRVLLQQIAALVIDAARAGDHVFRYGSSEFLILAVEVAKRGLEDMANSLLKRIGAHRFAGRAHAETRVTASIGAASFDGHPDYQRMLRRAENAVTEAALSGGNRCVVYL